MENNNLKEQFQQLQEQQQQKLLERRKKKEQANKNKSNKSDGTKDVNGKFGVSDDLGLKLADPPDKGFGYVSEELVDHLNDQIRQMKDENGRLYKLLSERDFEIRQLKKKNEESKNTVLDGPVTNETAATKIIELSKKVRELTAEKEAEKTRCKQFQKKCHDLQLQLQSCPPPSETQSVMGSMISLRSQADNKDDDGVDVKALQERLKQSEARLTDFRNQCQSLRQELKVAHKVLSQEIGENVNIQSLLNETSNWRGRAQQIIALQQKVDELKVQLDGAASETGSVLNINEKGSAARKRQEDRYREELRRMERERKEAQENNAIKLKALEVENEDLKDKLGAAKTRIKVLSNEIKGQKEQVKTLLKKSRNDDEFIDALMKQQGQLKQLLEEHTNQQTQQQQLQQQQLHQMSMKSQQDNNVVEQLKAIAAQKESQVKMLEMELQHLRMAHAQNHNPNNAPTPQSVPGYVTVTASVDSRPTTAADSDAGTQTYRQSRDLTQSAMSTERTRSASRPSSRAASGLGGQMNNQMNQQELSALKYQCQELEVMSRATEVEKDKMTELVQVLQERLAEETQKLTETQCELQAQKRLAVELEKKLGRQNLESGRRKGRGLNSARDGGDDDDRDESSVDKNELITRLEIQKDENESLKAALKRTLKAKEEDLKIYSSTLEETKKVFLQALRQMKEKQATS